jgi:hypothetical protein
VVTVTGRGRSTNQHFIWSFDGDWYVRGNYGSSDLRQEPTITIFKAKRGKTGEIDITKCSERFTPWDKGYAEKLIELFSHE